MGVEIIGFVEKRASDAIKPNEKTQEQAATTSKDKVNSCPIDAVVGTASVKNDRHLGIATDGKSAQKPETENEQNVDRGLTKNADTGSAASTHLPDIAPALKWSGR